MTTRSHHEREREKRQFIVRAIRETFRKRLVSPYCGQCGRSGNSQQGYSKGIF